MTRLVSAAETWETVYTAFAQVNFTAFDFNTVKASLINYVQLYFPEDFNDYIESSEFIAILELFAYMAELLAYRADLNAHENFITTAQRKESVLRLAQLISYTPTRNLPARGLVKLQSVTTTATIYDSFSVNLSGVKVVWNDPSNVNWKEQFLLIMNQILQQPFGTVLPNERVQVSDVLFELYTLNNNPINTGTQAQVFAYSATGSDGNSYPMEAVPITLDPTIGPTEKRPEINVPFTLVYANDGLGDASDTTGFLMFTKQGTLNLVSTTFDGVTPNQTYSVNATNVNNTDVWVNNVDPTTGAVITVNPLPSSITNLTNGYATTYGYWFEVDTSSAQNIIFNTNLNRHKYQIETLDNDAITLIFGDGEMADIPSGTFDIWYRVSGNTDATIPQSSVQNVQNSFTYVDDTGQNQTLSFTFSLTSSLQNGSVTEDIEHIRDTAPSVYYSQDRMVNGQDYNTYMLQDPSILKLRAINRTFAGDSKYIAWHDPSGTYENVKIFGDDLALYYYTNTPANGKLTTVSTAITPETLVINYIQPLLLGTDFFALIAPSLSAQGIDPSELRTSFTSTEETNLIAALTLNPTMYLFYAPSVFTFTLGSSFIRLDTTTTADMWFYSTSSTTAPNNSTWVFTVSQVFTGSTQTGWTIKYATSELIANSQNTKFWNTNDGTSTINYDTLNSNQDQIVVLSANLNAQQNILGENLYYNVLSMVQSQVEVGLPNINLLNVLPTDQNGDGIAEDMNQVELFNKSFTFTIPSSGIPTFSSPALPTTTLSLGNGASIAYNTTTNRYRIQLPTNVVTGLNQTYILGGGDSTSSGNPLETLVQNDIIVYVMPSSYSHNIQLAKLNNGGGWGEVFVNTTDVVSSNIEIGGIITIPPSTSHTIMPGDQVTISIVDYVYLQRADYQSDYAPVPFSQDAQISWASNATQIPQLQLWTRGQGRYPLNFAWFHQVVTYNLVDPAPSNIIDINIITNGYYDSLVEWLAGQTTVKPTAPTPLDLRTSYGYLLPSAMISDAVILSSGTFKILFGSNAAPQLQATFAVIRPSTNVTLTDNQVKTKIVSIVQDFFNPDEWDFGETFYFSELAAIIQTQLASEIDTIVIVPSYSTEQFGDLYQITAAQNELFLPDISSSNINIVTSLTASVLRQAGY